jgi:hypothetical protein
MSSDFELLRLHCRTLEVWDEIKSITNDNQPAKAVDPKAEALLSGFRPVHEVSVGQRAARFQKSEVWGDGAPVAYYFVTCRNPDTGNFERYSWRYRLQGSQPVLHKTFPVTVREWR